MIVASTGKWGANTCSARPRLDHEPLFGVSLGPIVVLGCWPQAHGGEAGIDSVLVPSRQAIMRQVSASNSFGQGLGRDRFVIVGSANSRRRPASSTPSLGGSGLSPGRQTLSVG